MCGRFTQHYTWQEVHAFLSVFGPARNLQPHYNIAPTDSVDVIRLDKQRTARAGADALGPHSRLVEENPPRRCRRRSTRARNPSPKSRCSATRSRSRRCIIPASGFYEWTGAKGAKQPHLFTAADGSPVLGFAGAVGPLARSRERR